MSSLETENQLKQIEIVNVRDPQPNELVNRIQKAVQIAFEYGGIDGEDHKQWVIDQMIRTLESEEGYKEFVEKFNKFSSYPFWQVGSERKL